MNPGLLALSLELERLYDLDDLRKLSRDVLGSEPLGGGDVKSSYVKILTERCVETDAVVALCDAVLATHDGLDPRILELRAHGVSAERTIDAGAPFGPFWIAKALGSGRLGTVYAARLDDREVRLKVLRRSTAVDRVGLHRFLTASRLAGEIGHPGLPSGVIAGEIGGRYYVSADYRPGETLSELIQRNGPTRLDDARELLRGILDALSALHARRLPHGALRAENVLVGSGSDGELQVTLLDVGSHHLGIPAAPANGRTDRLEVLGSPRSLSPEQIEGRLPDARSDLYSFGTILFQVLSGKPVFDYRGAAEAFLAHLTREAPLPSLVSPAGWVRPDVDDLVTNLLCKEPSRRPADAPTVAQALSTAGRGALEPLDEAELEQRIQDLLQNPSDAMSEEALVAAVREGGSAARVADAFRIAADLIDPDDGDIELRTHCRLLTRAARLYATTLGDPEAAERLYERLHRLRPEDHESSESLDRIRRRLGKHEDILEDLLHRCETETSKTAKAVLWERIGRVYAEELDDAEQALVAYTQAFCEAPTDSARVAEIDRLATRAKNAWPEILQTCMDRVRTDATVSETDKHALLAQMGHWYEGKIARPDLALPCYTAVLAQDPDHEDAFLSLTALYERLGQWSELGRILLVRADSPNTPPLTARNHRARSAEILDQKLGRGGEAREIYERVLREDPTHEVAGQGLIKLYTNAGEFGPLASMLEARARGLSGPPQLEALLALGETEERRLGMPERAVGRYLTVLEEDPKNPRALVGLDRCFSQTRRFRDLVENLHAQLELAPTPRDKLTLWERIARVWDEEFLDHTKAAEAWDNVLDLDPEHDGALTNLARQYRLLERWSDVVVIYDRHIELLAPEAPRRRELAVALGRVLAEGLGAEERAITVYEQVLERWPNDEEALSQLAKLRLNAGRTESAVSAIEDLAKQAKTPEEKAELYVRAAQAYEAAGDKDRSIELYKTAVAANPNDRTAATVLRAAYIARGDIAAAAELLEHEIRHTQGEAARAKLSGDMAALCRDRLKSDARAESWAKLALDVDPTNLDALRVMGDIAFDASRFTEATRYYEQVTNRMDALSPADAVRVPMAYAECLLRTGAEKKAAEAAIRFIQSNPLDFRAVVRASEIVFEHAEPRRAFEIHWELSQQIVDDLTEPEHAALLRRLGESARKSNDPNAAITALGHALRMDPTAVGALRSLALSYRALGQWDHALQTMHRQLEHEAGDARIDLLIEMGDLAGTELADSSRAAKIYLTALAERPNERRILTKLMQLYSTEKDWSRLVKVILKMADFVEDPKQKAKYLMTAGRVAWKEIGDVSMGSQIFATALATDPENEAAAREGVEVHAAAGNAEGLKEALKRQVKIASDAGDKEQMLRSLTALAELYLRHFRRTDQAIAVYEAADEVDPSDFARVEALAHLYVADPATYGAKAVKLHHRILDRDPFRVDSLRALRELHTEMQDADGAWCACQALTILGRAEPEEEGFYDRFRNEEGVHAASRFTEADFHSHVVHPRGSPLLTALFTVIQPAVVRARTRPLKDFGLTARHVLDPSDRNVTSAQVLPYAADVLGMSCPPLFYNPEDYGEFSFVRAPQASVLVGSSVAGVALPIQTLSFLAARHLSYYRPGLWVRQLVPTTTGLKAWLLAGIRLMAPAFPIPADLAGPVQEALIALDQTIAGPSRDHLARVVSKLISEPETLDLKKWIAGIDLTADRAGLVLSDDLGTAVEVIRTADPASSSVTAEERVEEIYKYSVSEQYLAARQVLGIGVGT